MAGATNRFEIIPGRCALVSTWPDGGSKSAQLFQRARAVLPGGISRLQTWVDPYPIYARCGEGAYIVDVDGTRRLDLMNNFSSLIHGHARPEIIATATAAAANGSCFAMPTESEIRLAELLCERVASVDRVRFCNSGTEAVMIALKAARARNGRSRMAKIEGAYHGMYDYAEVSLDPSPDNWGNDARSVGFTAGSPRAVLDDTVVFPHNDVETAERILRNAGDSLAAILIDPAPGAFGMIPLTPDFVAMIQQVARDIGASIVIDEVIAFRLDYHGAQARFGIEPDYTAFAKIIGGGFPVGAVAGTEDAMAVFSHQDGKPLNPSSGTFTANPVTMSAGLKTMELMTPEAYAGLDDLGEYARRVAAQAFRAAGVTGQVTGVGGMFALHLHDRLIHDYRSAYPTSDEAARAKALHLVLIEAGFIISPKQTGFLSTAMVADDLDRFAEALAGALRVLG
jgi:glutamate-1-semialdehyde 2,1-aminomutase